ncbi:MAG TPA: glycosyltransferase [Methylomirabilota bacterium]
MPQEVNISPVDPGRFRSVLPPERLRAFDRATDEGRHVLDGRCVWNINSTAQGGGVVELLRPLVGYARGAGVDARWLVIDGSPEFFAITKRIHNRLHGARGDGGPLDDGARQVYEAVLEQNAAAIAGRVRPGDVVIVHDPQPAGMIASFVDAGASVIWRCHVGLDRPNDRAREAWAFLRPYILPADRYVFSRESFAWEGLDSDRVVVIPPSIDAFAPKNVDLEPDTVLGVLRGSGILVGDGPAPPAIFKRQDGTPTRIERQAEMTQDAQLTPDVPVVLQVSRWDALKDPLGVIHGFAEHVPADTGAHLVYAAPSVQAVADDPEGTRVREEAIASRQLLGAEARARIHLASLPMDDAEENAIITNALQRHARVVVQKSLAEGFGLTVAEAMWKARPVVASAIGGIQDQIVHGETGLLLDDPRDLSAYGAAVTQLLTDEPTAERMGQRARERVLDRFLSVRSLLDYLGLIRDVLGLAREATPAAHG